MEDDYFISHNLYPNGHFYSGVIYQALGFPVLFAIGRTRGWLAQWEEGLLDKEQKISRPRQVYVGQQTTSFRSGGRQILGLVLDVGRELRHRESP